MTLHLIKLCVGIASVEELVAWHRSALSFGNRSPEPIFSHRTRMFPKRADEIVGQGSLFWVMSGAVRCRQAIVGLERGTDNQGRGYCEIRLDSEVIPTRVQPRRPFQGWRYLAPADAPDDMLDGVVEESGDESLAAELAEMGLL